MANFPLLRPNLAAWGVGSVVAPSEFWSLDEGRSKTINATDGSTHAPSTQITIGGSGWRVTGPSKLDDTSIIVTTGKEVEIQSGGAVRVESGAALTVEDGATFTLGGTTGWPIVGSRTFEVWVPARMVGEYGGTGVGWQNSTGASNLPVVRTRTATGGGEGVQLEIPLGPNGSTLTGLRIWSIGLTGHSSGTLNLPVFRAKRLTLTSAPAAPTTLGTATDSHAADGSDWTSWISTDVTISSALAKQTYGYYLEVASPYNATDAASFAIGMIRATYTVTQVRP